MIAKTFSGFLNHLLRQQSWAAQRLAAHAGAHIRLQMPPPFALPLFGKAVSDTIDVLILESGFIEPDANAAEPDLHVLLKPAAIPLLLIHHPDALKHVDLSGSAALASLVQDLVSRLEWDIEEDLSRVVGDVAAHRLANAGKDLISWQRDAFQRTAGNIAEYLTEENPMLLRRAEFERLVRELQSVQHGLADAEQRLNALISAVGN